MEKWPGMTYHDPGPQCRGAQRGHVTGYEQGHTRNHEQHNVVRIVEGGSDLVVAVVATTAIG